MALSDLDLILLAFLDSVDQGAPLPDGCDVQTLLAAHLIAATAPRGWHLTFSGRLRLENLRRMAAAQAAAQTAE